MDKITLFYKETHLVKATWKGPETHIYTAYMRLERSYSAPMERYLFSSQNRDEFFRRYNAIAMEKAPADSNAECDELPSFKITRLQEQLEAAHEMLDLMGAPRRVGDPRGDSILTVRGRLEYLQERKEG